MLNKRKIVHLIMGHLAALASFVFLFAVGMAISPTLVILAVLLSGLWYITGVVFDIGASIVKKLDDADEPEAEAEDNRCVVPTCFGDAPYGSHNDN